MFLVESVKCGHQPTTIRQYICIAHSHSPTDTHASNSFLRLWFDVCMRVFVQMDFLSTSRLWAKMRLRVFFFASTSRISKDIHESVVPDYPSARYWIHRIYLFPSVHVRIVLVVLNGGVAPFLPAHASKEANLQNWNTHTSWRQMATQPVQLK